MTHSLAEAGSLHSDIRVFVSFVNPDYDETTVLVTVRRLEVYIPPNIAPDVLAAWLLDAAMRKTHIPSDVADHPPAHLAHRFVKTINEFHGTGNYFTILPGAVRAAILPNGVYAKPFERGDSPLIPSFAIFDISSMGSTKFWMSQTYPGLGVGYRTEFDFIEDQMAILKRMKHPDLGRHHDHHHLPQSLKDVETLVLTAVLKAPKIGAQPHALEHLVIPFQESIGIRDRHRFAKCHRDLVCEYAAPALVAKGLLCWQDPVPSISARSIIGSCPRGALLPGIFFRTWMQNAPVDICKKARMALAVRNPTLVEALLARDGFFDDSREEIARREEIINRANIRSLAAAKKQIAKLLN